MHIVRIDLTIPGISFRLTPPGGTRETVRQTTLSYLNAQQAQVAVNGHFFLPFPSADLNAMLIGLGASDGNVYSAFEAPVQSYALVTDARQLTSIRSIMRVWYTGTSRFPTACMSSSLTMENPLTHARTIVNVSSDNPSGRAVASSLAVFASADTIAPSTTVEVLPAPNVNGWNHSDVTLSLTGTDNPGGAVRELHYEFSGAHAEAPGVVSGNLLSRSIGEEGTTTVTYFGKDYVGNEEHSQSGIVAIDKTGPVISGMPDGNCVLWPANGGWRRVGTVSAVDTLSGVARDSLRVTVGSNEPLDPESADVMISPDGSGRVDVLLRARRLGKGSGRTYSLTAEVQDLAGNTSAVTAACVVPHDQGKK